jgi:iron complex transport system substrate-binding protein
MKAVTVKGLALLLLLMASTWSSGADRTPTKVVSANLCTDQLLLMLATPEQIASISHLALESESSYMAEEAADYPVNHGTTEELMALDPELILVSTFNRQKNTGVLRRLGYRVEEFSTTENIDQIRSNVRRMAKLLGRGARGEAVIAEMDRRIEAASRKIPGEPLPALFYQPRGYTSGSHTLNDEALRLSGWRNVSADNGIRGYGSIDLETVLLAKPAQFFTSAYAPGTESLAQRQLAHPALQRITQGKPLVNISYRYWICGGPMIAEAIEKLAEVRRR